MSKDKKKRKKAADATLRNVRASQHRDGKLAGRIAQLSVRVVDLEKRVERLVKALRAIAAQL